MISRETFEEKFMELASLLNRTLTARQLKFWYKRVEDLDNQAFEAAIEKLIFAGNFPNLPEFMAVYRHEASRLNLNKELGCEWCESGWVHYWRPYKIDRSDPRFVDLQYAIRCVLCNPDKFGNGYDASKNPHNLRFVANDPTPSYEPPPNPKKVKDLVESVVEKTTAPNCGDRKEKIAEMQRELEAQAMETKNQDFNYF